MKNPWIFPAVTLAVGAVGGFISGKNTQAGDEKVRVESSAVRTRSSNRTDQAASGRVSSRVKRTIGIDEISRLPGNNSRIQALMEFYAGLTPEQMSEEAGKLDQLPMSERIMASFLLFGQWAEVDPTSAMSYSNTMGFTGMFVRPTILQSWASVDPANAAKYYAANPREFAMMGRMGGGRGPGGGQAGASIIASEWARQDSAAALKWANSLTTEKAQATSAVVGEVAKTDPRKAAEMLAALDGTDLGGAYRSVAAQYGALDFDEAKTWVNSLPADERAGALAAAIGGLSNNDPQAASEQVAQMEAGNEKNRLVSNIVEDWVRVDPQEAAGFLKEQDSERAQRDGMRQLMPTWVSTDADSALAYANSYEPGRVRDSALQSYVWSNSSAEPSELISVAETITDEGDRNRAIGIAAARWMREDEDAAKAYVESSTMLSDDAKERISSGRGMWGGRGGRGGRRGR